MHVLAVNAGSSSIKTALFDASPGSDRRLFEAEVSGIDAGNAGRLRCRDRNGGPASDEPLAATDHAAAVRALLGALSGRCTDLAAIGHRFVAGGSRYRYPVRMSGDVRTAIQQSAPLDPEHAGAALACLDALTAAFPAVSHVACFDTAFHAGMPAVAKLLPVPRRFLDAGMARYGFHGLSYEAAMDTLRALDPERARGRTLIAHLGGGSSMAAIVDGRSIETTMGFTPSGGLMMGTRTGDLDPGALIGILRREQLDAEGINRLVTGESGLLGVSGSTSDMQRLLRDAPDNPRAAEAVELFCYIAKKHLGSLVAVLGRLDTLVFTGGVGAHAAEVRARICDGLGFLGIELDAEANRANAAVISPTGADVTVRVIPADEERMIARAAAALIEKEA